MFWWRFAQDALPTHGWYLRRDLSNASLWPWGCPAAEDQDHLLNGCSSLRVIASTLQQWGIDLPTIPSWSVFSVLVTGAHKMELGPILLLCYAIFHIWWARNAKIHGQDFCTPTILAASIMENINCSYEFPFWSYWSTNQSGQLTPSIFWCPPLPKWIKINVDGAVLPNNGASIGILVRNHKGSVLLAAGSGLQHWDPGRVELEALLSLKRLVTSSMLAAKGVVIEGDCKNVINLLSVIEKLGLA
ncbi:hypothetical protein KSP39_PZI020989 [Platanthera zijinensis]|uniref:RNase H type-1 domain-containing protein n=1 Tax=Platanthera zijinensis TaxID=2320716 RepID=A0AAP0FVI2_9ASPA